MTARRTRPAGATRADQCSNLPRLTVRAEEVPDVLGVSADHFHRHIKAHVPVVRSGGLRLYRVADLDRWAEESATPILGDER